MRCIIAGGREIAAPQILAAALAACPFTDEITLVVSGMGRGLDQLGEAWARKRRLPIERFPADWARYGRAAGMIRNAAMAEFAAKVPPGGLIAIPGAGPGTRGMIAIARKRGLRVFVWELQKSAACHTVPGRVAGIQ